MSTGACSIQICDESTCRASAIQIYIVLRMQGFLSGPAVAKAAFLDAEEKDSLDFEWFVSSALAW